MGWAAASRAEGDTDTLEELRFHWGGAYDWHRARNVTGIITGPAVTR